MHSLGARRRLLAWVLMCLSLSGAVPSWAATASTNLAVTATVIPVCTVGTLPLVFGNYDPFATGDTDSTATLTVLCTLGTFYSVGLDDGLNVSAGQRRMARVGGGGFLNYEVYKDSARLFRWGNSDPTWLGGQVGLGSDQVLTVYGRVPQGQTGAPTGDYADTVTVTVNY